MTEIRKHRPRVYLDGYPLENTAQRGIARVVTETVARSCNAVDYTIANENPLLCSLPGVYFRVCRRDRREAGEFSRFRMRNGKPMFPMADGEFDVFHSTYFIPCPVRQIHKIQHVYDMIPEQLPEVMGRWGRLESKRKAAAIKQADTLVCISHATKAAVLQVHPDLQKRIEVVPLGGDHLCRTHEPVERLSGEPYVLFVGHRSTYKNFEIMLDAMCSPRWPSGRRLLVVGAMPSIRERLQVTYYGVQSKIEWLGNVADDRLAELYNNAGAFVFPSRLEGFGIPVLEAQLNFCPLVASDIPVFREIAGDGAVYFSPTDSADLLAAIDRAINERSTLQELGRANAVRYSWEAAAVKMVNIYNSCVQ